MCVGVDLPFSTLTNGVGVAVVAVTVSRVISL